MSNPPPKDDSRGSGPSLVARWWALVVGTLRRSAEHDAKDIGAAIAYYAFFSVFPFLVGLMAIAGYFLDSARVQEQILRVVEDALPGTGALVEQNLEGVVAARGALGLIGVVGLLWSGSAGIGAVSRAVNRAWGTAHDRPVFLLWIRYFTMTVATILLLTLSIGVTAVAEIVPFLSSGILEAVDLEAGVLGRLPGWIASLVAVFAMFALIYKVMPNAPTRWRQALPGAALAAVLFELGKVGLLIYLERIADFSIYGSLGSIIALLLWLYLSARILILGAEFNVELQGTPE